MPVNRLRIDAPPAETPPRHRTILLTSTMSGAERGKNLGMPGYSYDYLLRAFLPLLQTWGDVIEIRRPETDLEPAIRKVLGENRDPVHVSILPFQDVVLSPLAPNVVIPAWEFPDIPDYAVDGNPRKNWVDVANRCDLILAGGPFTANALERAGIRTPIHIVPTPTSPPYFQTATWRHETTRTIACECLMLPASPTERPAGSWPSPGSSTSVDSGGMSPWRRARSAFQAMLAARARSAYKNLIRPRLPFFIDQALTAATCAAARSRRHPRRACRQASRVELSGIVYSSILNPDDTRKNWEDLLTGFLFALRDCDDATLVIKLVARSPHAVDRVLSFYRQLNVSHRCKLVLIDEYLSEAQMLDLAAASTYYITTTRAEGMCLPLMNYLAAGRPAISPAHTAIGDYFTGEAGFVVESHAEPAAWLFDSHQHWRTSWARLVWPSLVNSIRESYDLAKGDPAAYQAMAARARASMTGWCDPPSVRPRLEAALDQIVPTGVASGVDIPAMGDESAESEPVLASRWGSHSPTRSGQAETAR